MIGFEQLAGSKMEEIKRGYREEQDGFICLICGETTEKGIIYQDGGRFIDAKKKMKQHMEEVHGGTFEYILSQDKKNTGLSEHQTALLKLLFTGSSDTVIQKELNIGSSSTVRNHRYLLKEKEKQAKLFLALMEMIRENQPEGTEKPKPHKNAKMVDDRYDVAVDETEEVLKRYFSKGLNGPLQSFGMKEKHKIIVLKHITKRFQMDRTYTEKEVNEVLKTVFEDFALIRRYLIEYGFMDRKRDCSEYWVATEIPVEKGEQKMDRKKELIMKYKGQEPEAGVYLIRNKVNGKVGVFTTPNMRSLNGKMSVLNTGTHMNKALQDDWKEYGKDSFEFVVAEILEKKPEESAMGRKDRLKALEKKWKEQLNAYVDGNGYHKRK